MASSEEGSYEIFIGPCDGVAENLSCPVIHLSRRWRVLSTRWTGAGSRRGRDMGRGIHLGAASAAKDLLDVEHADLHEPTLLGVVELRALDDDGPSREVNSPGERGRAAQDPDYPAREQLLDEVPV